MGYYHPLLRIASEIIRFNNFIANVLIFIPFGIGLILGILIMAKVIEYFLEKYEIKTYYLIIGFVLSSILKVILNIFEYTINATSIIIGLILFVIWNYNLIKYFKIS